MKRTIKRRAVFAEIHQDTRGNQVHIFSLKYRKKDGTVGFKMRVSKSSRVQACEKKFKQNVNINHIFLLQDHDINEVLIDLMIEYNEMLIDHTT